MLTEKEISEGFKKGFDCSMQVAGELAPDVGLTKEQGMKLMSCFGVGAGLGSLCGAVSGALMIIGYRYGNTEPGDMATKGLCMSKKNEFCERFQQKFGSMTCPGIMGYDLRIPEESKKAGEEGLFDTLCPKACMFAVETVRDILKG